MLPSARDFRDFLEAVCRMAVARVSLVVAPAACLKPNPIRSAVSENWEQLGPLLGRVRMAIGRAARRVPWRSDCLVQALAAQSWLRSRRIPTELSIGVHRATSAKSGFEAHAWLSCGGDVVVGGDVSDQLLLFRSMPVPIATPDSRGSHA